MRPGFVDCHSHVLPSGDDGASTVADGAQLCREAARRGTRLLFATPHVWPQLTPTTALLVEPLARYVLDGTDRVLMEVPFVGSPDLVFVLAENAEAEGLRPVIAHPERAESVLADPSIAAEMADRGWTLQVNGSSLLGRHGPSTEHLAWELVERG